MNEAIRHPQVQLPDNEKQVYLDLVEKTRSAVYDAIEVTLSHEDIRA